MTEKNRKSKWGFGVFILYGGFVVFILSLVIFTTRHDMQLVDKDYYQKDQAYQEQIERINRTNQLDEKLAITWSSASGNILIKFPVEKNKQISGNIKFFRPSNAQLDFEVPIKIDSLSVQEIDSRPLSRGYWKVIANWTVDSIEYYQQEPLIIN